MARPAARKARALGACRPPCRREPGYTPLARHVHPCRAPHDGGLRHHGGHREPHACGILPVLRRGLARVRAAERPLRPPPRAAGRRGYLHLRKRPLRARARYRDAHRVPRRAGAGRGRRERRCHRRGQGRLQGREARGHPFHRAGHVRGGARAVPGGGRPHPAGVRLAHDVLRPGRRGPVLLRARRAVRGDAAAGGALPRHRARQHRATGRRGQEQGLLLVLGHRGACTTFRSWPTSPWAPTCTSRSSA